MLEPVSDRSCLLHKIQAYMRIVIWPQITQNFYTNGDPMRAAFLSSLANLGLLIGGFVGGCLAKPIGQQKYQLTFMMGAGGALLAGKLSV